MVQGGGPDEADRGRLGPRQTKVWVGTVEKRSIRGVEMRPIATRTGAGGRSGVNDVQGNAVVEHEARIQQVHSLDASITTACIVTSEVSNAGVVPTHTESGCKRTGRGQLEVPNEERYRNNYGAEVRSGYGC